MKITGKNILITGGAKRLGRSISLYLAEAGANIAVTYRTSKKDALYTVNQIKSLGVDAFAIRAEAVSPNDAKRAVTAVIRRWGSLDVLVNNAANFLKVPFLKLTNKDFDESIDTNLRGPYLFSIEAGKVMLKQKAGKIINMADWAGLRPYKNYIPYCISKGGVITLTKALAKSLAPYVQVNAVMPGAVLLPEGFDSREKEAIIKETPLKRIGSPEDIASTVKFLIEGSDFITGACIPVDGGRLIA